MEIATHVWIITVLILCGILLVDALIIGRRPHIPSKKECVGSISFYIGLSLLFGAMLWKMYGAVESQQFLAAWVTEYSLSMDNLFIFLVIMTNHKVPRELQQFILMMGILIALVLRAACIALGAAVIEHWTWVFFLFGAYLIHTAIGILRDFRKGEEKDEHAGEDGKFMRWLKTRLGCTNTWEGEHLWVLRNGKMAVTLAFFTVLTLGGTNLVFSLDSIPAVFGLTTEPYIVFAATAFALMGLRQLFFLLEHMVENLRFLPVGLFFLLCFIGVNLFVHAGHHYHLDERLFGAEFEISTGMSLLFIVTCLGLTALFSVLLPKREGSQEKLETEPLPEAVWVEGITTGRHDGGGAMSPDWMLKNPGLLLKMKRQGWTYTYHHGF